MIPALDGTRAIAALSVVLYHWTAANNGTFALSPGPYAVIFFFVLSGFLITTLLLREEDRSGLVNLRAFWLRRAIRILPAFYVFLLIQALLIRRVPDDFVAAAFYMSNYFQAFKGWVTTLIGPTWSLSVEEQFYFLWPMLFVFITSRETLKKCLLFGILAVQILRAIGHHFGVTSAYMYFAFEFRADALMIGCFMAIVLRGKRALPQWMFSKPLGIGLLALFPLLMIPARTEFVHAKFLAHVAYSIVAYASVLLIMQAIAHAPAFLENKLMKYLGSTSYSIYLYHYAVLDLVHNKLAHSPGVLVFGVYLLGTIAAASLSYLVVEKQFLRLKVFVSPQLPPDTDAVLPPVPQPKVIY